MESPAELAKAAFTALTHGDPHCLQIFRRAINADPGNTSLVLGEAEALLLANDPHPTSRLEEVLKRVPEWSEGQATLASMRWELGNQDCYVDSFRAALRAHPHNPQLWNSYLHTLAGAEDYLAAATAAAEARRYFNAPALTLIEASNRGMVGEDDAVESLLSAVPASRERDEIEVRHRIRLREYDAAGQIVDRLIRTPEAGLSSWALAEVVWRKMSDPRWRWLAGAPQFIVKTQLSYSSDQLERLARRLASLHRQQRQPIGQSVRGGTQTRGRLLDRQTEEIVLLRKALQSAVDDYRKQLPAWDEHHPLLRHRTRRLRVEGGWSVRLTDRGFHVPHLHSAGVLSSAFYVRLPALDNSSREGWLELGRPPPDLRSTLEPLATIEPEVGSLVLFPSYLYHGTRLFRGGERMSVAFDAV